MKAMQAYDQTTNLKQRSKDAIIHFDEGLIGFSEFKDFVLMQNSGLEPFHLLQSLEAPEVGFLVLEASAVMSKYYGLVPPREWDSIGVTGATKPLAFLIVVVGNTPENSTGNFQAPLLVNYDTMVGKQIILTDSGFSVRQPLV